MAIGINLLPEIGKEEAKKSAVIKKINFIASIFLVLDLLAVLIIFSYRAKLISEYNQLNEKSENFREEIEKLQEIEWNLKALKSKASSAASLLKEKTRLSLLFTHLEELTPSGIHYTTFSVDKKKRVLIGGVANSFSEVAGFVRALKGRESSLGEDKEASLPFKGVVLTSAGIEPASGLIQFTLVFDIEEGALK